MRQLVEKYRGPKLLPVEECPTCHRPMPRKPGRPKQAKLAA
jgi:hypothetical protein